MRAEATWSKVRGAVGQSSEQYLKVLLLYTSLYALKEVDDVSKVYYENAVVVLRVS